MAVQLVRDMTGKWKPADYADKFTSAIHALAAQRVKAGKTEKVTPLEDAAAAGGEQRRRPHRAAEEEPGRAQGGAGRRRRWRRRGASGARKAAGKAASAKA